MSVTIELPKNLQVYTDGNALVEIDHCRSIFNCLRILIEQYPGLDGEILDKGGILLLKWSICINNRMVSEEEGLSHPVKASDVITILPMIAGG